MIRPLDHVTLRWCTDPQCKFRQAEAEKIALPAGISEAAKELIQKYKEAKRARGN